MQLSRTTSRRKVKALGKGELMSGLNSRRNSKSDKSTLFCKAISFFVALVLLAGLIPSQAFAQTVGEADAENLATEQAAQIDETAASELNLGDSEESSSVAEEVFEEELVKEEFVEEEGIEEEPSKEETVVEEAFENTIAENAIATSIETIETFQENSISLESSIAVSTSEASEYTVSVKITGLAPKDDPNDPDETSITQIWIPLTEYTIDASDETTAWDLFAEVLDQNEYTYVAEGYWYPYSITTPDGTTLEASSSAPWSYWSFFVNDDYASVGANEYILQDGDVIELSYIDGAGSVDPEDDVTLNSEAEHPDIDAEWSGYLNGGSGNVVTDLPTATDESELLWQHLLLTEEESAAGAWSTYSDPLIIGEKIYVVSGSTTYDANNNWAETKSLARLQVINTSTGEVESEITLARGMDSQCRMVYSDGIIVIPLAGGYIQAVSASTLESIWLVDAVSNSSQSVSSLTVQDGYVYVATLDSFDSSYVANTGTVRRINLYTGALAGTAVSDNGGYYWSGGIVSGSYYLIGDDYGTIRVYTTDLNELVSTYDGIGTGIRSTFVQSDGYIYAVSKDGVLHKLALSDAGNLSEVDSVSFAASSTSTPTIVDGVAYVGGSTADYMGVLAVIDLESMTVQTQVTNYGNASGGSASLPGEVKSAPLVSIQSSGTYIYFTCNAMPGGLYVYRVGNSEATMLYSPEDSAQNYTMASAFVGSDGTLYYINDSGYLFAIAAGSELSTPEDPSNSGGDSSNSDGSEGQGSQSGNNSGSGSGNSGATQGSNGGSTATGSTATANTTAASVVAASTATTSTATASTVATSPVILSSGISSASDEDDVVVAESAESEESEESETSTDLTSSQISDNTGLASDATATVDSAVPSWLPILGIIIGALGIIAVLIWLLVPARRRRSDS